MSTSTNRSLRRRPLGGAVALVAALLVLVVAAASCGTGPEGTASRVDPAAVPFELLEEPDAPAPPTDGASTTVYMEHDDRLVGVPRSVADDGLEPVLDALAAGPTADERTVGLSSALPPDQLAEVTTDRGVAFVDLRESFADLARADQVVAIAQIVYTLTSQPGIGRVSFTLEGESIELPRGDGALTVDALARDDFDELAPAP